MAAGYWAAVEELFSEAAGRDPAARAHLLDSQRASQPDVVAEVESLLAFEEPGKFLRTAEFLGGAGIGSVASDDGVCDEEAGGRVAVGRTIGHYRLVEWLGAGGMGQVFRADDLALGRPAALKLLPRRVNDGIRTLLLREADACARLQHPAIATFYEAGDADGETFIAMEFVAGQLLRRRLVEGPLPVPEALAITRCLLEALGHAHAGGIVHRDIKPENIIITPAGAAKLLDFGIAKRVLAGDPSSTEPVTSVDASAGTSVVGTLGYFAPEQLRGEPLDARTDLFQVAIVLYEMLTGRPAFGGSSTFERIVAHATRSPDLEAVRDAGAPAGLIDILRRALARDPSDRYASAAEFLRELDDLERVPASLPPRLAVLDLVNTGDPDDAWIGSGVAEHVGTNLARLSGLSVVARAKTLRAAREREGNPLEIGRLLGCRWILTGSFHRTQGSVTLDTTLFDVTIGRDVARATLEGARGAITTMADRLCRGILRRLDVDVAEGPSGAPGAGPHVQAFECYARARRLFHRLDKGTMEQARELYERAVAIDPTYAWALAGLAAVYAMRFPFRTDPLDLERAADYARQAIAADPALSDSYAWLGYVLMRQERMDEALESAQLAATLDPENVFAPYYTGCVYLFSSRPDQAVAPLQRAIEIDPSHGFAWMLLANAHMSRGRLTEARWCLERAVALERAGAPGATIGARAYIGECQRVEGCLVEARATCLAAVEETERSDHMYRDTYRGIALCALARTAFDQDDLPAARAALDQVLAHVRGRDRMLGGGHLVVQALAGLARAGEGAARFDEGRQLFGVRDRFNFSVMWGCDNATTLCELGRAALTLGLTKWRELLVQADVASSYEARRILERNET